MTALTSTAAADVKFGLCFPCRFSEVGPAAENLGQFLLEQGFHEEEIAACQSAMVEALNNAIQYVRPDWKEAPIRIHVVCNESHVEFRVQDHTPGFELKEQISLPSADSENGRGLYIIRSLMDGVEYTRGRDENILILQKNRTYQGHRSDAPVGNLQEAGRKVAECERVISEMAKELCFRSESLAAIFRWCTEAGRAPNLEQFTRNLIGDLLHITSADWYVLRLVSKNDRELRVFGASDPTAPRDPLPVVACLSGTEGTAEQRAAMTQEDVVFSATDPGDALEPLRAIKGARVGLVRPIRMGDTLIGTLAIGKRTDEPFTPAQIEVIHTLTEFLGIQIINSELQEDRITHRLVTHELDIARNIQRALLPKKLPAIHGFSLAGYCESARQVGGDFFDVLRVSDHSVLLVVADVMGKGVPAAMFAAILHRLIRAMPEWLRRPSEMLNRLNWLMYEELSEVDMFITAQLVLVDAKHRTLTAASAGHCPVLVGVQNSRAVTALAPDGMPLGILSSTSFTDETIRLEPNARILLYTDGVTDLRNGRDEMFGQDRLARWIRQSLGRPTVADALKEELVGELNRFQGEATLRDDQTLLLMVENEPNLKLL